MQDDPIEFTGSTRTTRADPKGKSRAVSTDTTRPVPPVVADVPETPEPNTHPKHAILRPRLEYEAAQAETQAAQVEDAAAKHDLAVTELAKDEALRKWLMAQPKVDPDALLRDHAERSVAERAQNVAAGLPPEGIKPVTHNRSPIDVAAHNRPRPTPQMANRPLLSPIARRVV